MYVEKNHRNMFETGPWVQRVYILLETPVTVWAMAIDSTLHTARCRFFPGKLMHWPHRIATFLVSVHFFFWTGQMAC